MMGVSGANVLDIVNGKIWNNLEAVDVQEAE
jgi:hypothetical protein